MADTELSAEWVVEERDLRAGEQALPGSVLSLVRWPVAFLVAWVGVGVPTAGASFTVVSGLVIACFWLVINLARRGTDRRAVAKRPLSERSVRLSVDSQRLRWEAKVGRAGEHPVADVGCVRVVASGMLLHVGGTAFFVPARALDARRQQWRDWAARFAARPWPMPWRFTAGLWAFALAVGACGFFK